ncbi:ATP-dependent DNA helicase RecQ [Candidatus Desantisbacteria bacterium CG2_30_40_21]|uniref:DNA helicase RecQ n=5 Tax=unclassified Candidatus Desantisiibacteriota TaxID=3106372 RepID=A0A2M7JC51_9BACT|nr:MAG: ATP-dependent DNA helicase RecQ [Candidatus Desantisbacteria bacterium CG2_30_40_21]PIP41113.1 MAG: DNA helicase RecQ [Candidatus Desantisbacteria bacterium CG23_combo_of_CG06-09_8_20_14_all_40_23]PIX16979.1 MAG: DNA helicase RecQ [Candidatus Desantisbacteria bacterium CG_4_8_14_3_um_filter_40_12]PIY20096.1 MAG: DNA helicase RecQ [Candidatus Desantisbacteria bacterium CG_4_10_14_3_um_filter_40_18]
MINQAKIHLKNIFGYEEFRPLQREIIENILKRRDTLIIMPTGGGKSLCYQIPALLFEGLTVVVSPLISLMSDQIGQLRELGIKAVALNSIISYSEYQNNIACIMKNEARLVYLAPETLLMPKTLEILSNRKVDCIAIDEAHCISEWGHDFRPEYRKIVGVRLQFPKAVCVALTATATPRIQQDIKDCLHFETSNEFIASFNRENLFLQIVQKINPVKQTIEFLEKFPNQSGIIYCLTRKEVDGLAGVLKNAGFSVKPYHAGLSDEERHQNQELFIRDDIQIMVATIAFGMGINKPNVRFVLHYNLPKNIEGYYQQIGRAGRDGLRADCLLLFSYGDIIKIKYFINQKDEKEQRIANIHLNALVGFAETNECRRIPLLRYFGEQYSLPSCEMCDNCSSPEHELVDITIPTQKFLSCVKRTGELFGTSHIIDVLRGSKSQKIINFNHDKLSTYAIGMEYSKQQWFYLSRQFLQKGLLRQDMEFGGLRLTPQAWEVLQGKNHVFGMLEEQKDTYTRGKKEEYDYDKVLFEQLRQKRKELADKTSVPPYVIFPDKTLIEMATFFPQSGEALFQLHGVGAIKFEKYGNIFLELLCQYCQTHHIEEKFKLIKAVSFVSSEKIGKHRHILVGEGFNSGKSIEELTAEFSVKPNTIISHLYKYITEEGSSLRYSDEFLTLLTISPEQREAAFNAFDRMGTERLKPVFDALDGQVSYDELHLLRLWFLVGKTGDIARF